MSNDSDPHTIFLIPQDLRRKEMLVQIGDLFERLEKASQEAISRIDGRISQMKQEVEDISRRADFARQQVDQIRTQFKNKGVRIYSTSRFPSRDDVGVSEYKPLKRVCTVPSSLGHNHRVIKAIHTPFSDEVVQQKLQFFQFAQQSKASHSNRNIDTLSIPWERISHVTSLVRFNSSINPFVGDSRDSTASESLFDTRTKKKHHLDDEDTDLDASKQPAPASFKEDDETGGSIFKFNTDLSAAPTLIEDLPSALPDLDGIADDFFDTLQDVSINFTASSSLHFSHRINETIEREEEQTTADDNKPAKISSTDCSTSNPLICPAPPPPPPPPPIPPLEPPPIIPPMSSSSTTNTAPLPAPDGGRASLLESIRNAGGKPKKGPGISAKDLKIEKKKKNKVEVISGDYMSDLRATLDKRRERISGGNDAGPRTSTPLPAVPVDPTSSALNRVAQMIPPPLPSSQPVHEESDDDEDWNS